MVTKLLVTEDPPPLCLTEFCSLHFWSPCPYFFIKQGLQRKAVRGLPSWFWVTMKPPHHPWISVFLDIAHWFLIQIGPCWGQWCDTPHTRSHLWKLSLHVHFALWWFSCAWYDPNLPSFFRMSIFLTHSWILENIWNALFRI